MLKRIEWANYHKNCTDEKWDKDAFSDESTFTVRPKTAKLWIWLKANTSFDPRNIAPTFKSWGDSRLQGGRNW